MIGKTLGHYLISSQLGKGGMGEVYVADDLNLNRKVALKFLPEAFAADPERMARFEREARLLASLNHPNIAAIHGLEQAEGKRFIVMELVEGETLAQRIAKGPLPADDALAVCRQMAEGLEAAHEKGVIHRDLKPANVIITEGDQVKILDFGLAKALSDETQTVDSSQSPTLTEAMTRPGVILGTAAYMSPEQAKGKSVDKRADIWAFGCILYECLTGKRPFEGETVTETLAAVLTKDPEWEKAPPKIQPVLRRCLERDPKKRLRDIGDAIPLLEGLPEPVSVKSGFPWIAWGMAALFLTSFAVMFWIHFRENPGTPPYPARFQIALPDQMSPSIFPTLALSPDGRYLAFSGVDSDGMLKIWLRPLDSLVARPLPGTEGSLIAQHIIWSADSRFIAFNSGGELKRIAVDGGLASICSLSANIIAGSWNRDDVILFSEYTGSKAVCSVSAAGGVPTQVTRPDPQGQEIQHLYPVFLPDGRHFLYFRESNNPEIAGIYIGSLDLKPEEQDAKRLIAASGSISYIPSADSNPGMLLFLQGRNLMAQPFDDKALALAGGTIPVVQPVGSSFGYGFFTASRNGFLVYRPQSDSRLTWIDRSGQELGTVGEPGNYSTFDLSKDADRLVLAREKGDGKSSLWVMDLPRGSMTPLTLGKEDDVDPRWSHDELQILFGSTRDPSRSPFKVSLPSSDPVQVFQFDGKLFSLDDCSPDGGYLLYHDAERPELWALPLSGEQKPELVLRSLSGFVDQARFSPDGRWIAFNSSESGRHQVMVVPFPRTGEKWQVSTEGGVQPMWGRNGRELYFLKPDGSLMAVDVRAGKKFEWEKARLLFKTQIYVNHMMEQYAPTPDGNRFLFVKPASGTSRAPFEVIINWTSLLKK